MSESKVLTIHIDGAARGNPGPAAFAFVIAQDGCPTLREKGRLGETTNNVAEYTALVRALEKATELGGKRLLIHSDSELLVKQMNGEYRVKSDDLRPLFQQARELSRRFDLVSIRHVPREQNSEADRLCNEALDGGTSRTAAFPGKDKRPAAGNAMAREAMVREEALTCLKGAATAWAQGNANHPPPEFVWDQLWSILEEHGLLRSSKPRR